MFMKTTFADSIKTTFSKTDNAKVFMRLVGEYSQKLISLLLGH